MASKFSNRAVASPWQYNTVGNIVAQVHGYAHAFCTVKLFN